MSDIKTKAIQLFYEGLSYKLIAEQLGISKSTAHAYVKDALNYSENQHEKPIKSNNSNVRSERTNATNERTRAGITAADISTIKAFTGNQLLEKEFTQYSFEGAFLELIGKPSKPFAGLIWGPPKSGKSNLSIRFADYLSEYFGRTCYIASEEGESATLQLKIRDIGGSDMTIAAISDSQTIKRYLESQKFDFVFIDSLNYAQIDYLFLEELKQGSPNTSFIGILQATKGGNFKGNQAFTHNCDFIMKVEDGIAYQQGRFNTESKIQIFEKPLYKKNPDKKTEVIPETNTEDIQKEVETIPPLEGLINIETKTIEIADAQNIEMATIKKEITPQNALANDEPVLQPALNPKIFLTLLAFGVGIEIVGEIIRQVKGNKKEEKD